MTTSFGAKTRVTFNGVDLIDLDSLEYPPSPSDDVAVRVHFADEVAWHCRALNTSFLLLTI